MILNQKISIENDANCFVVEEALLGEAKDFDIVFGCVIGTGVGGVLIINKNIHSGRIYMACEWGHNILHTDVNKCSCGNMGRVEAYISDPAL